MKLGIPDFDKAVAAATAPFLARLDAMQVGVGGHPAGATGEGPVSALCRCGHTEPEHDGKYDDCGARCLCELCPPDTTNDCWCGGFNPGPPVDFLRAASGLDEFAPDTTRWTEETP